MVKFRDLVDGQVKYLSKSGNCQFRIGFHEFEFELQIREFSTGIIAVLKFTSRVHLTQKHPLFCKPFLKQQLELQGKRRRRHPSSI
jgi:hypothetical protein